MSLRRSKAVTKQRPGVVMHLATKNLWHRVRDSSVAITPKLWLGINYSPSFNSGKEMNKETLIKIAESMK